MTTATPFLSSPDSLTMADDSNSKSPSDGYDPSEATEAADNNPSSSPSSWPPNAVPAASTNVILLCPIVLV